MSVSSRTPDDKMHRYLQRIQRLVGTRGKSQVSLIKSRTKSPMNIKTPRLDNYLKYEHSFKTLAGFCDRYNQKHKLHFIDQLKNTNKRQRQTVQFILTQKQKTSQLKQNKTSQTRKVKQSKIQQVVSFISPMKSYISRLLKSTFQKIRLNEKEIQVLSEVRRQRSHRRKYSQIYAESVTKSQHRSPSPGNFKVYSYKTPEIYDIKIRRIDKQTQTRLIFSFLQKIVFHHSISHSFSSLKSFDINSISKSHKEAQTVVFKKQKQIQNLNKQISNLNQQLKQKDFIIQYDKSGMQSFQVKMRQEIYNFSKFQFQIKTNRIKAITCLYQLIKRKLFQRKVKTFQQVKSRQQNDKIQSPRYMLLCSILRNIINKKTRIFFTAVVQQIKIENLMDKKHQRPHSIRTSSIYSQTHQMSIMSKSNYLDTFSRKLNKAFELRITLQERYSYAFQKIDYAALLNLSLSKPLIKVMNAKLTESFRKIHFYSLVKSQSNNTIFHYDKLNSLQPNCQKLTKVLKNIQKKSLILKIQAYNILRLSHQFKKGFGVPSQFVISEIKLKKQINQFLQQRNKMQQKAYQTWQKTKQILHQDCVSQNKANNYQKRLN